MQKKLWFYLFWGQFLLTSIILVITINLKPVAPIVVETDIGAFLDEQNDYESIYGKYVYDGGYIADAETAVAVGGAILDSVCIDGWTLWEKTSVEYDPENRLWKVQKGYIPHHGGIVVLDQDTGEVLILVRQK